MSGKAVILLVTGVIIISSMMMFNVEAASTRIVKNFGDYYMRQNTQNLAQSGVNLAITKLAADRKWRTGFSGLHLLDGVVDVGVTQTTFDGVPVIAVASVGATDYGNRRLRRDTSVAYLFWSKKQHPVNARGLMTLNSSATFTGNATIDGRDHDLNGALIAGSGVPGIWTTASTVTLGSSGVKVGGTDVNADYAPANPYNPAAVKTSQILPNGFPQTPDSVFGGADSGFPEGTLKAIAKSGYAGSQYVTDPTKLKYPLTGVTYVEMPSVSNIWSSANFGGEGILIVHNSAGNSVLSNAQAKFTGLIITDDVVHLHGDIIGGIVGFKNSLSGNAVGNGNSKLLYSREALTNSAKFLDDFGRPAVFAWWE